MLHDAHNHLQDAALAPHLDRIAATVADLRIGTMVVNGTHEADWPLVSDLARRFPFVRPSYGLHPWHAGNRSPDWLDTLRARLAEADQILADRATLASTTNAGLPTVALAKVGEIGLDRWMTDNARLDDRRLIGLRRARLDEQTEVFLPQLALATADNRPVTIHCLQAWGALDTLLHTHRVPARGFLLHAYGGPAELIPRFAALGAYFSFTGYFLDPRHAKHLDAFRHVPPDRLLVETDAPAMPLPQSWRTHKLPPSPDGTPVNHPGNLDAAYAGLASLLGLARDELESHVSENVHRFFG